MSIPSSPNDLLSKEELLLRLEEAEEALRAIRSGEVDALVVSGEQGEQVFTLTDAKLPYQTLIEEMNEGALTLSSTGIILYCNACFAEILGLPMEAIPGKSLLQFLIPSDQANLGKLLEQRPDGKIRGELTLLGSQGEVPVRISMKELVLGGELRLGVVITDLTEHKQIEAELRRYQQHLEELVQEQTHNLKATNESLQQEITERKQAEEALRRSEALLLETSKIAKVGGWEFDLETMRPSWSLETYRIHEVDPSFQPDFEHAIDFYSPEVRPIISETVRRAMEEGQPYDLELPLVTAKGRNIWIRTIGQPEIRDGRCVRLFGTFQDITESKHVQEHLTFQANILANITDVVYATDEHLRLTFWNHASEKVYGWTEEEVLGRNVVEVVNSKFDPEKRARLSEELLERGSVTVEVEHNTRSGRVVFFESTTILLHDSTGKASGFVSVNHDITERKQAESIQRQLAETLEQRVVELQTLMDVAPVGIAIGHDPEGNTITVNRLLTEWLNAPAGTNVSLSVSEEERQVSYQVLRNGRPARVEELPVQYAALNAKGVRNDEFSIVRSDGRTIEMLANAEPLFDDQGRVRGSIATYIDITERKRAEQALLESENRFRTMFQEVPSIAVQGYAMDGTTQYWNSASEKLYGYSAEEAIGRSLLELIIPPEMRDRVRQDIQHMAETGQPIPAAELSLMRKDGSRVPVYSSHAIISIQGHPRELFCLDVDLTERKRAEQGVAYQAKLLASVNDAIVGSDSDFRLNAWNASAESTYGWKAEEVLARNGLEVLQTEWPQADAELMRRMIEETGRWRGEATQLRKDGTRIPVEVSSMVLCDENGQVTGYVSVNRDITDRKRTEEALRERTSELEELNRELARSNEELEQFAYVASHDLQEPLRTMSSFSQLLEKRYKDRLDQDANDFINFIVDAATRMQKLITDLLAYSRAGHGGAGMVEVDCNQLVHKLVRSMSLTIEAANGQVTFDRLPVVTAYEAGINQLFQNLIGNALKFRGEQPPCIHISAQQAEKEWIFSVQDNGIGIEPQYSQRIFMIFQRLHPRDKYAGTGIGLSICKKIVESLGGRIWTESELGKGSTFYFTVPN